MYQFYYVRSVVDVAIRYHATSVVDVDAIKSKLGINYSYYNGIKSVL